MPDEEDVDAEPDEESAGAADADEEDAPEENGEASADEAEEASADADEGDAGDEDDRDEEDAGDEEEDEGDEQTEQAAETGEEDGEASEDELEEIETAMAGEGEEAEEEPPDRPVVPGEGRFYGTGRRKEAVARVWIEAGSGDIDVNGHALEEYFSNRARWTESVRGPLKCLGFEDQIDVRATAEGGGLTGQADALELGIARALVEMDENARHWLRPEGHLTRDDREVERKKINQPGARAKSQVSKR